MGLIIPKCNAEPATLDLTLKVYYEANDWVENTVLIDRLSKLLINAGIEKTKKEPQSYTKKTQVLSYYGLLEWEDKTNNQSRRRITEYGRKLYEFRNNNDIHSVQTLLLEILSTHIFGRNVLGCDSDSDLEAPNIFIKSCLLIKNLTNKEFGYILGKMEYSKMELIDALLDVMMQRRNGITVQPDEASAKWSDPKPILALADWGLLDVTKQGNLKMYNVKQNVIESHNNKLIALKTKNTESAHTHQNIPIGDKQKYSEEYNAFRTYITAIKSKPFLLLAGISGTGKSRIARELARACWDIDSEEYKDPKPRNFELIQVKPNWHDSTELIGYVSRISEKPVYVAGEFLRFITRAWENLDIPHILCLDEMNMAPVEQYFAEYLSVIESRKCNEEGHITTDPIIKKSAEDWYKTLITTLTGNNEALKEQFLTKGISIPQNLIVVGTVNMDETTFSFSRKVLDRAMTIEMNEVNLYTGLDCKNERLGKLDGKKLIGTAVEGADVYAGNEDVCNKVLTYLQAVNSVLNNTPFKIAYRTRNDCLLYVINNLPYNIDKNNKELSENGVIAKALDEITSMKILSRIEGDEIKVKNSFLKELSDTIEEQLSALTGKEEQTESVSIAKLKEMQERLLSGYTSFWS